MAPQVIRTFSYHYRQKFGHGVGKIPLDLGQPCPNRLHGGCIFCRPAGFTPAYLHSRDEIAAQVDEGKASTLKGRFKKYFAYLQQETCTAVPVEMLLPILRSLLADADCVGLILSTRPDFVAGELLVPLAELVTKSAKECLFELGLQSVHERSLTLLNRNHSFADFQNAVLRIQEAGCFQLGAHLIFGIPGESREDMLFSLKMVCEMGVKHLKLHHLQVMRDTVLANLHKEGKVSLFTREGYLDFLLSALQVIPDEVVIHRLWATAHPEFLLAPKWNCLAGTLSVLLQKQMVEQGIWQGQLVDMAGRK
ncbi:MAG: TIGR01212 family radical SAM protein [Proteobacteria bacterium]|nr:TIGR01212 family radical SAM protein [Pseudomonadota bacterium]